MPPSSPSRRAGRAAALALAVCAVSVPASAQAQAPVPPDRPDLAATVTQCTTGVLDTDRSVDFTGSMPAVDKAVSMAMRFELYERPGDTGPYTRLKVPGFSTWNRSDRGVAGFVYDKRVERLAAPSAYRVEVRFRWLDARGKVVKTARRTSPSCHEPDLRPDLHVTRLLVGPARPDGTAVYSVTVANAGRSAVLAPFTTSLTLGGATAGTQTLTGLGAGASSTLTFTAPRCVPGADVVATADAGQAVDEVAEGDNTGRTACPT